MLIENFDGEGLLKHGTKLRYHEGKSVKNTFVYMNTFFGKIIIYSCD